MDTKSIENFTASINLIENTEKYILIYSDKNYFIQRFLFDLFKAVKQENYEKAIHKIKAEHKLTEEELYSLKEQIVEVIENIASSIEDKKYIKFSFTLFNEKTVHFFSNKLKGLFQNKILIPLIILSFLASGYIFLSPLHNYSNIEVSNISILETLIIYLIVFVILMFHELGHASATHHYKIKPKEIGFGFYLIFPVLFANVTKIWKLTKGKRIIVNFAGIYFQLVFNIVLVVALFVFPFYERTILTIIRINIFVALYALIPFIRNDGYWIYSDYFDIQNLNKKSNAVPYQLVKTIIKGESIQKFSLPLVMYSIGNYIFLFLIIKKFVFALPQIFTEFFEVFSKNSMQFILINHFGMLLKIFISFFFVYIILKTAFTWYKETFKTA